jgi:putative CocE/NonD family hydrolase
MGRRSRIGLAGTLVAGMLVVPMTARAEQSGEPQAETFAFTVVDQVDVVTRYGDTMNIDLCFPSHDGETPAPGPFPVIGELTPYANLFTVNPGGQAPCFMPEGVKTGYVGARINSPGSGDSQGGPWDYGDPGYALRHYDAIEWLGTQPWSTGKFGSIGGSGVGVSQVQTSAYRPPHYTTAIFQVSTGDPYLQLKPGGLRHSTELLACTIPGLAVTANNGVYTPPTGPEQVERMVDHQRRRVNNPSTSTAGHCPPVHGSWGHPVRDGYWDQRTARLDLVEMPVWVQGSPDDLFSLGSQDDYFLLGSRDKMFSMGFTSHAGNKGDFDQHAEAMRWFDHWLKGIDTGIAEDLENRRFRYNVFPDFVAKSAADYPIPQTRYTDFYLSPGAPDPLAAGSLSLEPPTEAGSADYVYLPTDGKDWNPFGAGESLDQRVEAGGRVTFVGDVLTEDTEVTGPITMKLFASATATDTDWVGKLLDIAPDGSQTHARSNGYLKSTFRTYENDYRIQWDTPPGEIVEYDIEFYPTTWMFKEGHRIGLSISSADLVEIYPNPNPAQITVHYGPEHPSAITLPVIPDAATDPVEDGVSVACVDCAVEVRAGQRATAQLEVTNTGSKATTVSLSSVAPQRWEHSVAPERIDLDAGESKTVVLSVRPPNNARDTHEVTVSATSADGATGSDTVTVAVSRPGGGPAGAGPQDAGDVGPGGAANPDTDLWGPARLISAVTGAPGAPVLGLVLAILLGATWMRRRLTAH